MKVYMKRTFNLLLMILISVCAYAEIALGTLLPHNNLDYDDLYITNKKGTQLPNTSGLTLYAGDSLQSGSDKLTVLIPPISLLIKVGTHTNLKFDMFYLGGKEFVDVITVVSGNIKIESHPPKDLLQVLVHTQSPQKVIRIDRLENTLSANHKTYVQFIKLNATIDTTELNINSKVFFTDPDIDIRAVINSLEKKLKNTEDLNKILTPQTQLPSLALSQHFTLSSYFINWIEKTYVTGKYNIKLQKGKFSTLLQLPLFFPRDNFLYHPPGLNDMVFGGNLSNDFYQSYDAITLAELGLQSIVLGLLNKIETISYGNEQDSIYVYFGKQKTFKNLNSTLFTEYYKPIKTLDNNFNMDLHFALNFNYFGTNLYSRIFQNASQFDSVITNYDLIYNRVWGKPFISKYPMEIGLTLAIDFAVNKFSGEDEFDLIQNGKDKDNKILFTGLDLTFPIINTFQYQLNIATETGIFLPVTSLGILYASDFSNWAGKGILTNIFYKTKNNSTVSLDISTTLSKGIFGPHFVSSGYEYFIKPLYNRLISTYEDDYSKAVFSAFQITPEINLSVTHKIFSLDFGAYYPISLEGVNISDIYQYTNSYINFSLLQTSLNPKIIQFTLEIFYSQPLIDFINFDFTNFDNYLDIFTNNSVIDLKSGFLILESYGFEFGIFNTPNYNNSELLFQTSDKLPEMTLMPYATFYIKL